MNIFSYGSSNSADYFQKNIEVIQNFPFNTQAQIKSFGQQLSRTDEGLVSWSYGFAMGTQLKETVKVIETTVQQAFKQVQEDLASLKPEKEKGAGIEGKVQKLSDDYERNAALLEGLKRIRDVYTARYAKNPEHEGVKELQQLVQNAEAQLILDKNKMLAEMEANIQQLQESMRGASSSSQVIDPSLQYQTDMLLQSVIIVNPSTELHPETFSKLEEFCQAYCGNISLQDAQQKILLGRALVQAILQGTRTEVSQDAAQAEKEVAALTWYLMSLSLAKKEGYNQGTFVIEDEGNKLYNFLMKHPGLYPRDSSHFVNRSPKKHQGIDVFKEPLPAMKRTLLFSQITNLDGQTRLYIKPENFSASPYQPYDFSMHAWEFAVAQYNKVANPGSDDLPNMRKERVPAAILKEFNKIVEKIQEYKDNRIFMINKTDSVLAKSLSEAKADAKLYGIAFMKRYIDALDGNDAIIPADFDATQFRTMINEYDHLDQRTGREVYLTQQELSGQ